MILQARCKFALGHTAASPTGDALSRAYFRQTTAKNAHLPLEALLHGISPTPACCALRFPAGIVAEEESIDHGAAFWHWRRIKYLVDISATLDAALRYRRDSGYDEYRADAQDLPRLSAFTFVITRRLARILIYALYSADLAPRFTLYA